MNNKLNSEHYSTKMTRYDMLYNTLIKGASISSML